jgi:hypothetical protein
VPEIVPADKREILLLEERLEVAVNDVLGVEGCTLASGENELRVLVGAGPELLPLPGACDEPRGLLEHLAT